MSVSALPEAGGQPRTSAGKTVMCKTRPIVKNRTYGLLTHYVNVSKTRFCAEDVLFGFRNQSVTLWEITGVSFHVQMKDDNRQAIVKVFIKMCPPFGG